MPTNELVPLRSRSRVRLKAGDEVPNGFTRFPAKSAAAPDRDEASGMRKRAFHCISFNHGNGTLLDPPVSFFGRPVNGNDFGE